MTFASCFAEKITMPSAHFCLESEVRKHDAFGVDGLNKPFIFFSKPNVQTEVKAMSNWFAEKNAP